MEAVNAFNQELFSLMDSKPPISRAKMISITKSAIKAMKLYKHVVQIVEKFIKKCKPEYKVAGLYVVDSIVRQSRHQFGADKDVFGPRFTKNITGTFENLCLCPIEDRSKLVRVLNLWQKNGVFKIEVIQPLLDMAAGSGGGAASISSVDEPGSPPLPAKEPVTMDTANSTSTSAPQLDNSDAFAAVAQLFQSSQGQQLQQMLQNFQQQPAAVKPEATPQPQPQPQPQPPQPQPQPPPLTAQTPVQIASTGPSAAVPQPPVPSPQPLFPSQAAQQKAAFDAKLLDRFDYDDEPEAGEETKKDEIPSHPPLMQHPPGFPQHMEHFNTQVVNISQDLTQQVPLPPNGQLQAHGLLPGHGFPVGLPPMGHAPSGQPLPGSSGPTCFPGLNPPQNAAQPQQESSADMDHSSMRDGRQYRRSHSGSRSPKRRRSRSNSRTRRSRHRRSRSRSRDRRHPSPRSRSQERREREKERERRQRGVPSPKNETLSVCSTTLWVGQLDKRTQQQDVASLLEEFGQIESINMIPPRGCAYIVMVHRQDAFRALQKLSRGLYKVNQKAIKIAWALNKGIKPEFKQFWDVELGVTYIPWSKVKEDQLEELQEGGMLDVDTLAPEWNKMRKSLGHPEEPTHNGRSEQQPEEAPVFSMAAAAPTQVPPIQQPMMGSLRPPVFPGPIGMLPPSFTPGIPPPPFMRPGFNPLQMPPGFPPSGPMHLGPGPSSKSGVDDHDPSGLGSKKNEVHEGPNIFNNQLGPMGNQVGTPSVGPPSGLPGGPLSNHPVGLPGGPPIGLQVGHPGGLQGGPQVGHPVGLQGGPQVGHLVGLQGGPQVGHPVGLQGGPQVGHPVGLQGGPQVALQGGSQRGPQVGLQGGPQVGHPVGLHGGPQVGLQGGPQVGHPVGLQGGLPVGVSGAPPGGHLGNMQPPSPSLLGPRPGIIHLHHAGGPPPQHMQRFPPPHGPRPPLSNMPQNTSQMIPRVPHPQMMRHEPPAPKGGFGMPPLHNVRAPFPHGHGPPPQGSSPAPFIRPGGPRSLEGPEEMDERPFRGERPGFRDREQERDRDWDRDRERDRGFGGGGRRSFGDGGRGGSGDKMDGRDRHGGWQEDGGSHRWERDRDRDRERRDWRERRGSLDKDRERGRGEEGERDRGRGEGGDRNRGEGGSREKGRGLETKVDKPKRSERRERTSRWDKDDRLAELENMDKFRSSNSTEPSRVTPVVSMDTVKEPDVKNSQQSEQLAKVTPTPGNPASLEPAQSEPTETKEASS